MPTPKKWRDRSPASTFHGDIWQRAGLVAALLLGALLPAGAARLRSNRPPVGARDVESILPSAKLPVPRAPSDLSLRQVAIDGDTAVVATNSFILPSSAGNVWVFRRTREGWRQDVRLEPAGDGAAPASFGLSVAISGGTCRVAGSAADQLLGGAAPAALGALMLTWSAM
jgi:hypothetical protein